MKRLAFLLVAQPWAWNSYVTVDSSRGIEAEFQLDPYYSAADLVFSLDRGPVTRLHLEGEQTVYPYLLKHFFDFRTALVEGSVYPFPVAGVAIRSNYKGFYQDAQLSDGVNLVRSLTSGFPEPWAQSVFLGSIVHLTDARDSVVGRGYAGLLASWGLTHIAWNQYVGSPWIELEAKLKGSYIKGPEEASWSFAVGAKEHWDDRIVDLLRLSIKRSRTDRDAGLGFSLVRNTYLELRGDLDRSQVLAPWRHWRSMLVHGSGVVGKKWPVSLGVWVLDLGLNWQSSAGYRGDLALQSGSGWSLIVRPNFEF